MGCDIHGCYEVYRDVFGEPPSNPDPIADWMCAEEICHSRMYSAWGKIAGVRGYGPPVVELRGIPQDASSHNRDSYEAWEGDSHSATWLTLPEMRAIGSVVADYIERMERLRDFYGVADEHVRMVCWFDN